MKDNPTIGSRVGWIETYTTVGQVLDQRLVWGTVTDLLFHHGEIDGFSIAGDYARVTAQDGRDLFLHFNYIHTIAKA